MTENSARTSVIELLERLSSEDEAEVLAAARDLKEKLATMGVTWEELLVPDDDDEPQPINYGGVGDDDDEDDADDVGVAAEKEVSFEAVGEAAEDVKRIEQIKAMSGISESLREELDGFLEDIKENEFTVSDRQYLKALQQRLGKGSR